MTDRDLRFDVLDHGYVRLIDKMGSDEDVVSDARVSTGRGFESWEPYERCSKCEEVRLKEAPKHEELPFAEKEVCEHEWVSYPRGDLGLLDTLYREEHTTPFELGGELKIEVQAPIMVFREWHRHRVQAYSELSARHTQMPNLHYLPEIERFQKQSPKNKQMCEGQVEVEIAKDLRDAFEKEQINIYSQYEVALKSGLAKEVSRINTPVSRYSRMRAKASLRNWLHFLNLRLRPNAQWEIRQYAEAVAKIIQTHWPRTYDLFLEYTFLASKFSRTETEILHQLVRLVPRETLEELYGELRQRKGEAAVKRFASKLEPLPTLET